MFHFDGQCKRRRAVSRGGASKKEDLPTFLESMRAKRQKREEERTQAERQEKQKIENAIKIQSIFRGRRVRHQQYKLQRISFDNTVSSILGSRVAPTADTMRNLLRKLLFFHSDSKDTQRRIWMCQHLLENGTIVKQLQTNDHQIWLHQIKHLLLICSRSLETSVKDSEAVTVQLLLMLKLFTLHDFYHNPTDPSRSTKDAAVVTGYLVTNGYFRYLRVLLKAKAVSTISPQMAAAIRDLVMSPLHFSSMSKSGEESMFTTNDRHAVLSAFISDILCPEMTETIVCILLPSIADQSARFPFSELLATLLTLLTKADGSGGTKTKISPTPWLLYGVLTFSDNYLGPSSDPRTFKCYIRVLQILLEQLPHPDDDDSDSEKKIDSSQSFPKDLIEQCLDILFSKNHTKILRWLSKRRAGCAIYRLLMSESRLPIHKTRSGLRFVLRFLASSEDCGECCGINAGVRGLRLKPKVDHYIVLLGNKWTNV